MTTETETRRLSPNAEKPAEALRRLLEDDDRNVTWLAKKTGLSVSHLFRVLEGERAISLNLAVKLSTLFGVPVSKFVESEAE